MGPGCGNRQKQVSDREKARQQVSQWRRAGNTQGPSVRPQPGRDAPPSGLGRTHRSDDRGKSELEPWFPHESREALRGFSGLRKVMPTPAGIHNPGAPKETANQRLDVRPPETRGAAVRGAETPPSIPTLCPPDPPPPRHWSLGDSPLRSHLAPDGCGHMGMDSVAINSEDVLKCP